MSGPFCLQRLRQLVQRQVQEKTFNSTMSKLELISASEGKCVAELTLEKSHLNLAGTMHGGVSATLIDNVSTYALLTVTDSRSASVDLNVSFLGPAKEGDVVRIEASTLRAGQTLAYLTVDIRKGERLLATGRHTKYLQKNVDYFGNTK
ncbi:acyl-coenzyme A thioesterase 13 [Galendromus occidentalis]|uniref:Acyl-coenzyme A thioesterase 13 n=1 Tax=Galendromus occidentalis TaxID=34638 RepID=A0AAJ6QU19_9ACAR|nr:acyl-coenzyme A thioesterase 13 [Galendromus occidentalis]